MNLIEQEREARKKRNYEIRTRYGLEKEEKIEMSKDFFNSLKGDKLKKKQSKLKFSVNKKALFNK